MHPSSKVLCCAVLLQHLVAARAFCPSAFSPSAVLLLGHGTQPSAPSCRSIGLHRQAFLTRVGTAPHSLRFKASSAALRAHPPSSEVDASNIQQEIASLRVAEIKQQLTEMGVYIGDCFEKDDLIQRLVEARISRRSSSGPSQNAESLSTKDFQEMQQAVKGMNVKLRRLMAREGTLGANVKIDEKDYYALSLQLPDMGREADFIIDTAASNSIITPGLAATMNAQPTGVTASVSAGTSAGGGLRQVRLGRALLQADGESRDCGLLDPVVMELPVPDDVGGLLGLDFISRFDVLFDYANEQALFCPTGSLASRPQDESVGAVMLGKQGLSEAPMFFLPPPAGLYNIKVRITVNGKNSAIMPAVVDMGSTFTIVNWAAIESAGLKRDDAAIRLTDSVISGAAAPGQSYVGMRVHEVTSEIKAGGMVGQGVLSLGTTRCLVADLPAFDMLGMGGGPAMVIGLDVLSGNDCSRWMGFSVKERRIWLQQPAE